MGTPLAAAVSKHAALAALMYRLIADWQAVICVRTAALVSAVDRAEQALGSADRQRLASEEVRQLTMAGPPSELTRQLAVLPRARVPRAVVQSGKSIAKLTTPSVCKFEQGVGSVAHACRGTAVCVDRAAVEQPDGSAGVSMVNP